MFDDLYQELILDHNRHPHNFRVIDPAGKVQRGHNPLCGDQLVLYLQMEGDTIADISFQGSGCAISTASASLMTDAVKGRTRDEAQHLFDAFHAMATEGHEPGEGLGKLAAFAGVGDYPARVKCATLAWHTLLAALGGAPTETVSTE